MCIMIPRLVSSGSCDGYYFAQVPGNPVQYLGKGAGLYSAGASTPKRWKASYRVSGLDVAVAVELRL